jgi:hypothetical protein
MPDIIVVALPITLAAGGASEMCQQQTIWWKVEAAGHAARNVTPPGAGRPFRCSERPTGQPRNPQYLSAPDPTRKSPTRTKYELLSWT